MADDPTTPPPDGDDEPPARARPARLASGVAGLDDVLRGGFFERGVYVVRGTPGAGKTILGNQMSYHHAARGGRALYVTILAETHDKMLSQLAGLEFFDPAQVGSGVVYLSAFSVVESEGLAGLLALLRRAVRDHEASLLVLDGMVNASAFAPSDIDYKKFIHELQTWVAVVGCTVVCLASASPDGGVQPEHTMVDAIVELGTRRVGLRVVRELQVTKPRGGAFAEGAHTYVITSRGLQVYPRLEAHLQPAREAPKAPPAGRIRTGHKRLDAILHGGLVRGSTTLLLGSSGVGKTILGLHFLAAGAKSKERGLYYGFFEPPQVLIGKADRIGLAFSRHLARGTLDVVWRPPAERLLDAIAYDILARVDAQGVTRLMIDGLVGFKESAYAERLPQFFAVLSDALTMRGVTTVITEETRELFVQEVEVPTGGVSAVFHNILFLRKIEVRAELVRLLAVMKTRDSGHDRAHHQFEIGDRGITIGGRFQGEDSFIVGGVGGRRA